MSLRYVAQPNVYGCAIACVAMVVGKTYDEMEAWLAEQGLTTARRERGLHDGIWLEALARHGLAYSQRYRCDPMTNAQRKHWPPDPFAPVHIVSARVAAGQHAIVWLASGSVLDPYRRERVTLADSDYLEISQVVGLYLVNGAAVTGCASEAT